MNSGWLAWECIVFGVFIAATSCVPLWQRRRDASDAGGSAKRAYIFAGGGVSVIAMILSVARGTLGVRSFLGKFLVLSVTNRCRFLDFHIRKARN